MPPGKKDRNTEQSFNWELARNCSIWVRHIYRLVDAVVGDCFMGGMFDGVLVESCFCV